AKSNYGAAKTGLIGLTRVLAAEGAAYGIKVNAIAPIAGTRMLAHALTGSGQSADPAPRAGNVETVRSLIDRFDPALVATVVAFLPHQQCPVSGEISGVGAGQFSRVFLGRTAGYFTPDLTIEDVLEHLAEIRHETGYTVPAHPGEEVAQIIATMTSRPR